MGQQVTFPVDGADAEGFVSEPSEGGAGPAVLVLGDAGGVGDHAREVAGRLAQEGFTTLVTDPGQGAGPDRVLPAAVEHLLQVPQTSSRAVGLVGFGTGARAALAGSGADGVAAVVAFYPGGQADWEGVRGPVLAHLGEGSDDTGAADGIEVHRYAAADGFFDDTHPTRYDIDAAQLAWQRTLEFLQRALAPAPDEGAGGR